MNCHSRRSDGGPREKVWGGIAAAAMLLLSGCFGYPDSSERVDDDIVFTTRSEKVDFGSYKTFAIDPEVRLAEVQADNTVEPGTLDPATSAALVSQVALNMMQRGYVQVDVSAKPSLGITLTAISGLVAGTVYGGYYGGYYGYYWGYPGWGYYYPYPIPYAYETGTLAIDMIDLGVAEQVVRRDEATVDAGTGAGSLPVIWAAAAYKAGVDIEKSTPAGVKNAQNAIDQAFKQSPYLRSN